MASTTIADKICTVCGNKIFGNTSKYINEIGPMHMICGSYPGREVIKQIAFGDTIYDCIEFDEFAHLVQSLSTDQIAPLNAVAQTMKKDQSKIDNLNKRIKELEDRLSKIAEVGTGVPLSEGRASVLLDKIMEWKEIAEGATP